MNPTLFQINNFTFTTFGLFVALGLLTGTYFIWRLSRIYEIEKEATLDLIFYTFVVSIIGARLFFVIFHLSFFDSLSKVVLFNLYPGLSLWGGLVAGFLTLLLLTKQKNLSFYLIADIAVVGLFIGLSLGSIGCLLGSCQYGVVSNLPISVNQVGLLDKRFPVQIFYSLFYFLSFLYLWKMCLRFHFEGKIASIGLIILGLSNFFLYFYRGDTFRINSFITVEQVISLLILVSGTTFFYQRSKRSISKDVSYFLKIFYDPKIRQRTLLKIAKSWYNQKVFLRVSIIRWRRKLGKKLHVKANPSEF
ncbi:prolipoprotein diacylglyceryl transferase [Candidatus Daviesbacteria bacterium]|nr:prolipoprotein diacylglyceryl transferase [Candidatus Daviesbacteria bacterium]